jgi:hypothetical protein
MKFNDIAFEAGVAIGDWETRPKTGASASKSYASDGDYFQALSGAIYRYSDDIGEWVRPFIYDGTPVLDIRIQGSVLPENESPAWTETTSDATITTDGTRVTFNRKTSTWGYGHIYYDHEQTQKSHFFQGYIEHDDENYHSSEGLAIVDGTRVGWLVLDTGNASQRLYLYSDAASSGERLAIVNLEGRERYLEFYFAASGSHKGCYVYIDHEEFPSISMMYEVCLTHGQSGDNINTAVPSGSIYFVGSRSTRSNNAEIILRECFWGRY